MRDLGRRRPAPSVRQQPRANPGLFGIVQTLARGTDEAEATVTFRAELDGGVLWIPATIDLGRHSEAVRAHVARKLVCVGATR